MSDLIHEGPKDPNKPPVPGEEKPTTERERMKKVYTYVAILFTVAFLLILWTFLMNQRSINEIKDGNTALQSTLQQNDSLEAHIAELEEQLATAEEDKKALDETVGVQSNQLRALDWLLEIENAYNTGDLDARERQHPLIRGDRHGGIPAQGAAAYRYHRRRRPLPRRALPVHCGQAVSGRRKIRSQMVIYFTTITR